MDLPPVVRSLLLAALLHRDLQPVPASSQDPAHAIRRVAVGTLRVGRLIFLLFPARSDFPQVPLRVRGLFPQSASPDAADDGDSSPVGANCPESPHESGTAHAISIARSLRDRIGR